MFKHDPADATTEQSVKRGVSTTTWRALAGYEGFLVMAMTAVKTGNGVIEVSIYAAEDSSATNATEIKTSGVVAADADGDYVYVECSAEEVAHVGEAAGYNFTHVAGYVDCHHADDITAVTYIRWGAKRAADALTSNYIS
jgi:hypothetical protein